MIWGALWFVASSALTAYAVVVAHRRGRAAERLVWERAALTVAYRAGGLEAARETAALWALLATIEVATGQRYDELVKLTQGAFGRREGAP